jgi:hypothetical protein
MRYWGESDGAEVIPVSTSSAHEHQPAAPETESLAEQLQRKNVQPIRSAEDLACEGIFDDDEELDEFLAHIYSDRRAALA